MLHETQLNWFGNRLIELSIGCSNYLHGDDDTLSAALCTLMKGLEHYNVKNT